MSLLARHRFMVSRMAESFGYEDEDEVDAMMREPDCLSAVDFFFTADGPSKIVIAEEVISEANKTGGRGGAETKGDEGVKVLKVYSSDIPTLPSTAVFFRTGKGLTEGRGLGACLLRSPQIPSVVTRRLKGSSLVPSLKIRSFFKLLK